MPWGTGFAASKSPAGPHTCTPLATPQAQRNFNNIEDGFYISPAFLDKISIHVAKNFLDLPKIKVPLILGIWGGKGQGKTFQCNLAYKKLGIAPIVMSAGELESGNAGEPAKLIRQRYREASDIIKKGKMSSLFINDLDAGAGRMGDATQYTVNNQVGGGSPVAAPALEHASEPGHWPERLACAPNNSPALSPHS